MSRDCEDCKTWAKLVHQMLPALWQQQARVDYFLREEDRDLFHNNNITLLEERIRQTIGVENVLGVDLP